MNIRFQLPDQMLVIPSMASTDRAGEIFAPESVTLVAGLVVITGGSGWDRIAFLDQNNLANFIMESSRPRSGRRQKLKPSMRRFRWFSSTERSRPRAVAARLGEITPRYRAFHGTGRNRTPHWQLRGPRRPQLVSMVGGTRQTRHWKPAAYSPASMASMPFRCGGLVIMTQMANRQRIPGQAGSFD